MKYDILSVADLCFDMIVSSPVQPQFNQVELLADDYMFDLGGSVGIFACQFARLGGNIALLGSTGKDMAGQIVLNRLTEAGVDTRLITIHDTEKTPMGLNISCKGDRAMLTYLGAMNKTAPQLLTGALLHQTRHWHIGGYFLLENMIPAWPGWLQQLRNTGVSISLDTNWDPFGNWENVLQLLPLTDVFLPNEAEAKAISGKNDLMEAGLFLAERCPLTVIKMGENGAMIFTGSGSQYYPVPSALTDNLRIADTTGAGDNFDAGFIFSWLSGKTPAECIHNGFRCAVASLQGLGGIETQISHSEKSPG
ncbi:carbohydrate kinase family protein [Chitinophaga barathri]|uniref:Carbohydrate kinase family protein n=1 Tax=Chitinophaga barathri TaxID=1647451 RepID=A0A3N4MF61_9BACT|nr:carbohydrate kinase family protein [Chitinophaga barathri]RPD42594.1 carbohydrate kinase family protein [Chitinophaga barathri]